MNQMAKKLLAFLVVFTMVATSVIGVVEPLKVSAETQIQTELPTIVVTGEEIINGGVYSKDNVGKERAYTLDEVKAVANEDPERTEKNQYGYSALNTYGSKNFYLQEGVRLEALLEKSGLTDENFQRAKIAFVSGADGVSTYFDPAKTTYGTEADKASAGVSQKLSAIRYYYPKGKETPPSEEGAQEVPTVLAWAGAKKADQLPTQVKENDGLTLATGQLGLGDYNNPMYNRDLNKVEVGKSIETKVLSIDKDSFTRREILLMERGDRSYTYQTKGGLQTDYVRGVPMSVLLKDYKDSDIVKFSAADGYEVAASGMTKAQLIKGNYILGYEKGTGPSTLNGIFDTAKKDPQIHGCFSLYGDGVAPAKLVNSIAVSKDSGIDFATSNYKHINNGGVTGQEGPYNIDAITGATLTVEGPGVKNSVPLSVRILENQNAGGFRGVYSDLENGNKTYEGIKLSYILNSMPSGNKVELTDTAKKVQIKNRARQTIAEFTLEQIKEAEERGKPILVSYGVGSQDGTNVAPYVYDGAAGYKPELNNDDGCLKLVYDKEAITGDANGAYSSFGNMAYIYVMEESEPGYKHTGAVYGDPNYSQYILSMAGTGMGREINLTVKQLEELANSEEGIGDYNSSNIAFRKAYSLTNTTYWSVNEYEGVKLYNLLQKYGLKNDLSNDTKIRFNAWDGYISNEVFTIDDLKKPEKFGYYEKNALDINDGSYTPTEEDKKDAGYPVMLAYGVNRYPYVKSPQDEGYAKGLTNSGGPLRVI
ncbi:MAG: hypothetical protein RR472_00965, partial [Anaerovoracaceae bacterium]